MGSTYAQPLTATGGIAPYTWSITAGALPDGLVLDPVTGAVSGMREAKKLPQDTHILVNLSGRGDKDADYVAKVLGI
ncbi:hypothetical protein CCO03_06645 [Comamonas serinivorans]|uniref:Uncharacterized protein n=1 Tax=Comamonas serinivorans TaxID=1082851 RepID=A0A1Y0ELE5_9BURK|nr:Ig domain-containing protein [Comamonas serinivorans]ARU04396.1 hypothetical protein CCO03_06645 [Comamonas serinivorans]